MDDLDHLIRQAPPIVLLFLIAVVLSSVITVGRASLAIRTWFRLRIRWRQREYERLRTLRAGIGLSKLEEILGQAPLFVRRSSNGSLTEHTFRGRGYWVQAVTDGADNRAERVLMMAITACSLDFAPTIATPFGEVHLNHSRFVDVGKDPTSVQYFLSGATANSYFFDVFAFGNPGQYKMFFIGINDTCACKANYALRSTTDSLRYYDGDPKPYSATDQEMAAFRRESIPNTYAEAAPLENVASVLSEFPIGVDRILARTLLD